MIEYRFIFDEENELVFPVDETQDTSHEDETTDVPPWMELEVLKCAHCPIPEGSRRSCPAALAIRPAIEAFNKKISWEQVSVKVTVDDVVMDADTTMQNAVRSLVGLLMALSTCPTMSMLKPMARYHLPFGSSGSTVFRVVGMYLTGQYLRGLEGKQPDWEMKGLMKFYDELHNVNAKMADRIRMASEQDATVNSLIILDTFGHQVQISINKKLQKLMPLFEAYFKD